MPDYNIITETFATNTLLDHLNYNEMSLLTDQRNIIHFRYGDTIVKQNTIVTDAIFLSNGLVKKEVNDNKNNILLDLIGANRFIALPSMLTNKKHAYSIIAIDDVSVCFIKIEIIKNILINNGRFALAVINNAYKKQEHLYNKLICFNKNNVYGRLAYTILYLSEKIYNSTKFNLRVTRKELSQLIGLSRETLIKGLTTLKNDKVINVQGKHIEILDQKRLKAIAETG